MKTPRYMDYKKYYKEIKEKLIEFSEVVYYEPMTEDKIIEIEKKIGKTIKPLYREYLLNFGMNQDVFEKLITDIDSFSKDFDFIKNSLRGYLPVFSDIDIEDTIYII
jgi:arsenate reductase-like glutaredoxin family protein